MSEIDVTDHTKFPTFLAHELRQEVLDKILAERKLRLMVIIPANANIPGSPLCFAYVFLAPFLQDWELNNIHWGINLISLPNQDEAFLRIDLSTYPAGTEEELAQSSFPIYALFSDLRGVSWRFERHTTRGNTREQGLLAEFERMCLL